MFPFTVAGPRRTYTDFPFNSAGKGNHSFITLRRPRLLDI
ncbi:hypothetical protein GMA19_01293 [Paenibacillus polymyxa E681]|nr:hypothetical protein GE561_01293 [Paenibacillus polymyxa E681]QNV60971.1 hypothetical protein GMA19_01293 [Paenibacillus polymyxa E681]